MRRRLEILLKVMSHITPFLNWNIQLVLFICCHFFVIFVASILVNVLPVFNCASFQNCRWGPSNFCCSLLIETQRSSGSNCGAGMPLFSENIMKMTASHGVFHFRHNDVCALDSLRTVRRPSVPKCAKYSTMCFWRQLQRSRRVHCKGCWRFITGYAPNQVEGRLSAVIILYGLKIPKIPTILSFSPKTNRRQQPSQLCIFLTLRQNKPCSKPFRT